MENASQLNPTSAAPAALQELARLAPLLERLAEAERELTI